MHLPHSWQHTQVIVSEACREQDHERPSVCVCVCVFLSVLNAFHNGGQLSDTASVAADRSEEILVFTHNSEKRSAFNSDYLPLSLQSANCTLIVLHKKPVKFITASSQWLFWYWLKGLIKPAEREAGGQISDSEVIHEVATCDGLETSTRFQRQTRRGRGGRGWGRQSVF